MSILRYRHIGYVGGSGPNALIPKVTLVNAPQCMDAFALNDYFGCQHTHYTLDNIPITTVAAICCAAVSDCDRVEGTCLTGGITTRMILYALNVENCQSANGEIAELEYCHPDGGTAGDCVIPVCDPYVPDPPCATCDSLTQGKWTGSLSLRGGSLGIEVCCTGTDETLTFNMILKGCYEGCVTALPACYDPLIVNFGNVYVGDICCDCAGADAGPESTINLILVANCYPTTHGRHIGYAGVGTGAIPLIAEDNCLGTYTPGPSCLPSCDLTASITNVADCSCLAGTYSLLWASDSFWSSAESGGCAAPLSQFSMSCSVNLDENGDPDGTLTLSLSMACGADNIGYSDPVVIDYREMEDLDVTFTVVWEDPTAGGSSCGTCQWQYIAMLPGWNLMADNCTGGCSCVEPPSPGFDGEIQVTDCSGGSPPDCCVGTVQVRVMR